MSSETVPWFDDALVWVEHPSERLYIGGRWFDVDRIECMKVEVQKWHGTPVLRCDARKEHRGIFCPLWPEHDGPHIPATDELDARVGGFTITGLSSTAFRPGQKP